MKILELDERIFVIARKKPKEIYKYGKRVFKNPSEYECFRHLESIIPNDLRVEYETETYEYTTTHTYRPDFPIKFKKSDGTHCLIEYKGNGRAFDNAVRQKMIAVKKQYPEYNFYIVFHTDGKIGPKRKDGSFLKQSDWAVKNKFEFCIGRDNIPESWFI